jgi:DNA polymerase III subunit delta'
MDVLKYFKHAISSDKLAHLYILHGDKGSARNDVIIKLMNELFQTSHDTKEGMMSIANVHYIEPSGTVIKKEQILALQEEFSKTSLVSGKRVYVIEDIELISTSAANSLLKFLEEPNSSSTYGFLLSEHIEQVLPTILSRAQKVTLKNLSISALYQVLSQRDLDPFMLKTVLLWAHDDASVSIALEDEMTSMFCHSMKTLIDTLDLERPARFHLLLKDVLNPFKQDKTWLTNIMLWWQRYLLDTLSLSPSDRYFQSEQHAIERWTSNIQPSSTIDTLEGLKTLIHHQSVFVLNDTAYQRFLHLMKGLIP